MHFNTNIQVNRHTKPIKLKCEDRKNNSPSQDEGKKETFVNFDGTCQTNKYFFKYLHR